MICAAGVEELLDLLAARHCGREVEVDGEPSQPLREEI
jgi:hypothetical protein